jgi:hypothetical protein
VDYSPTTSAGTQIDKLIIANTVVTSTPTADLKAIKVYLNGAAWAVNPTASQTKTTSITGTGVLSIRGTWPALTTIGTDLAITPEGNTTVNVSAPLDAASVNHILISLADNGYAAGTDARTINLAGNPACAGSGALTVAGNAARTALVAANWTVTLNP